jgi:hypothetical protein
MFAGLAMHALNIFRSLWSQRSKRNRKCLFQKLFANMAVDKKAISISFDEENRIRILESEYFTKTENLAEECTNFTQSSYF